MSSDRHQLVIPGIVIGLSFLSSPVGVVFRNWEEEEAPSQGTRCRLVEETRRVVTVARCFQTDALICDGPNARKKLLMNRLSISFPRSFPLSCCRYPVPLSHFTFSFHFLISLSHFTFSFHFLVSLSRFHFHQRQVSKENILTISNDKTLKHIVPFIVITNNTQLKRKQQKAIPHINGNPLKNRTMRLSLCMYAMNRVFFTEPINGHLGLRYFCLFFFLFMFWFVFIRLADWARPSSYLFESEWFRVSRDSKQRREKACRPDWTLGRLRRRDGRSVFHSADRRAILLSR